MFRPIKSRPRPHCDCTTDCLTATQPYTNTTQALNITHMSSSPQSIFPFNFQLSLIHCEVSLLPSAFPGTVKLNDPALSFHVSTRADMDDEPCANEGVVRTRRRKGRHWDNDGAMKRWGKWVVNGRRIGCLTGGYSSCRSIDICWDSHGTDT